VCWYQPPAVSDPVGPTVSTVTQFCPSSFDTSDAQQSVFGAALGHSRTTANS